MTVYGYARVSSTQQDLSTQTTSLMNHGVEADSIYSEKISGKNLDRGELQELLQQLEVGDTLVVTKMDRISRNVQDGIKLIDSLTDRGIKLHVLNMGLFDDSPTSKLIRNILLSVGEWEREMILERQREGIELAKQNGKYKTRPMKYTDKHKGMIHAVELMSNRKDNKMTVKDICETCSVDRTSLYKKAREQGIL